jgi:monothiol bacilliredoxin
VSARLRAIMGTLATYFIGGLPDSEGVVNVRELTEIGELDECLETSANGPVLIFKHSTSCPTSAGAYSRFMKWAQEKGDALPSCFLVKVIQSRPLSNEIAVRLGVPHKSPQLILVKDGAVAWSASHHAIGAEAIEEALSQ